jgi:hypothetical protein
MPPWLPDAPAGTFIGERRLGDPELALIRRWVEAGAPEGDPADLLPPPVVLEGWQLGTPDLVVALPSYEVSPGDSGVYRNLVAPVPVSAVRYVKAVEIRVDPPTAVHHARLMLDSTSSSRVLDGRDAEPGFDGMVLESAAHHPGGFFVGWAPGRVATPGVDTLAWPLVPGTDLVLQIRVAPHTARHIISPQIGFYFAAGAPRRWPVVIMLESRDLDIPAGRSDYVVTDTYRLPVDVDVLAVYPHAHYLGKELEAFARPPRGGTHPLIRIRNWDFNWQDEYRFSQPVSLLRGSTITMRWRFDNSAANPRNPTRPPRRVTFGPRLTDEMASLVVQVLPRTAEDRETLERDLRWTYAAEEAEWVARRAYESGRELARQRRYDEAVARYREALSRRPTADVHAAMAEVLLAKGERDAARLHLAEAVRMAERAGDVGRAQQYRDRLERIRP